MQLYVETPGEMGREAWKWTKYLYTIAVVFLVLDVGCPLRRRPHNRMASQTFTRRSCKRMAKGSLWKVVIQSHNTHVASSIYQTLFSAFAMLFPPLLVTIFLPTLPIPGVLKKSDGPWPSSTKWLRYPLCAESR